MNSFDPHDEKYRCCCNNIFHVERGAYYIAIIGIAFSGSAFMRGIKTQEWGYMIGGIIGLLCYASIIFAQEKRDPSLYLPFLILNGIRIVLIGIYIPVLVLEKGKKEQHARDVCVDCDMLAVLLAFLDLLLVWFQCVVYRAYKYMKMTQSNLGAQMQV